MCGWPSSTVTIGARRSRGKSSSRIASSAVEEALPRLQRAEDEVGRGEADDVDGEAGSVSSSAAASTSGMTAPTPTSVTRGPARPRRSR